MAVAGADLGIAFVLSFIDVALSAPASSAVVVGRGEASMLARLGREAAVGVASSCCRSVPVRRSFTLLARPTPGYSVVLSPIWDV